MEVVCIRDFGHCKVGDVRELPDDAMFSELYFVKTDYDKDHIPAALAAKEAEGHPEAQAGEGSGEDNESSAPVVEPRGDAPDVGEESGEEKAPSSSEVKKATAAAKRAAARADKKAKEASEADNEDSGGGDSEAGADEAADDNEGKSEG